jgi:hypothetical protein
LSKLWPILKNVVSWNVKRKFLIQKVLNILCSKLLINSSY